MRQKCDILKNRSKGRSLQPLLYLWHSLWVSARYNRWFWAKIEDIFTPDKKRICKHDSRKTTRIFCGNFATGKGKPSAVSYSKINGCFNAGKNVRIIRRRFQGRFFYHGPKVNVFPTDKVNTGWHFRRRPIAAEGAGGWDQGAKWRPFGGMTRGWIDGCRGYPRGVASIMTFSRIRYLSFHTCFARILFLIPPRLSSRRYSKLVAGFCERRHPPPPNERKTREFVINRIKKRRQLTRWGRHPPQPGTPLRPRQPPMIGFVKILGSSTNSGGFWGGGRCSKQGWYLNEKKRCSEGG